MANLTCPTCHGAIDAHDVHVELGIANCRTCRGVLDLRSRSEPRPPAPLPERFVVDDNLERLQIRWRWFTARHLSRLFVALVWNGFLFLWCTNAAPASLMSWLPFGLAALNIGFVYTTLAGFCNSTRVWVDGAQLRIEHGPLPSRGNRRLAGSELKQLFSERRESTSKRGGDPTYQVSAVLRDDRKLVLLRGLSSADQALYLEQAIEKRLGIADKPVAGELPR
jgi:hypothetical protein